MWNFFSNIKKNNELREKFRLICKSITPSDYLDPMQKLEFTYTLDENNLNITGPFQSFYNIEPYNIIYNLKAKSIVFNGESLDEQTFSKFYKTVKNLHQRLISREQFIDGVHQSHETLVSNAIEMNKSASDYESTGNHPRQKRSHQRSSDVNTDILFGSDDGCSRSDTSRNRDTD